MITYEEDKKIQKQIPAQLDAETFDEKNNGNWFKQLLIEATLGVCSDD